MYDLVNEPVHSFGVATRIARVWAG